MNLLAQNQEVRVLHDQAIELGKDHRFAEAREKFNSASEILSEENYEIPGISFQAAEQERDLGFLSVREAIVLGVPSLLEDAEKEIKHAKHVATITYNVLTDYYSPTKSEVGFAKSEASIPGSLLGRLATVSLVIFDRPRPDLVGNYFDAQTGLEQGSNGYFRVSNALAISRHEKIVGNEKAASHWRRHAKKELIWTGVHDPQNLIQAGLTFANHAPDTLSTDRAADSITTKP